MINIIKPEVKNIVKLAETGKLSKSKIEELKEKYNPKQIELISACLNNDKEIVEKFINEGVDLSICNDYVLRYTVSKGFGDVSVLLLQNKVEV
jgi:hypothetical protein